MNQLPDQYLIYKAFEKGVMIIISVSFTKKHVELFSN